jgi:hypothetical protein
MIQWVSEEEIDLGVSLITSWNSICRLSQAVNMAGFWRIVRLIAISPLSYSLCTKESYLFLLSSLSSLPGLGWRYTTLKAGRPLRTGSQTCVRSRVAVNPGVLSALYAPKRTALHLLLVF